MAGDEVALTPKEFDLLALLAEDPGRGVHPRQQILEEVWDPHWYGPTKTLDVHVASLRKKLGDPAWIETVRGVGLPPRRPAPTGAPMRRRLLVSYLSLTVFVLLVLEIPLGFAYAQSERRRLTATVQHDALALSVRAEDALEARSTPASGCSAWSTRYRRGTGGRSSWSTATETLLADSDPPREPGAAQLRRAGRSSGPRSRATRSAARATPTRSTRTSSTSRCRWWTAAI